MSRVLKQFFIVALSVLVLASCTGPQMNDIVCDTVLDASSIDGKKSLHLDADSTVEINNLEYDEMYAIVVTDGSGRAMTRASDSNASDHLQQTESDRYNIIPNEEKKVTFSGADVGIHSDAQVDILRLKPGAADMTITDEHDDYLSYFDSNGKPVYEQYYHLDLKSAEFADVDLTHVVLENFSVQGNGGGSHNSGYVTIDGGMISRDRGSHGVFDLSSKPFVNAFNSMTINYKGNADLPWISKLYFGNPIKLEPSHSVNLEEGDIYVFEIEKSSRPVLVTMTVADPSTARSYPNDFAPRGLDGSRTVPPAPVREDNNEYAFVFPELDEPILFNVSNFKGQFSNISIQYVDRNEEFIIDFNEKKIEDGSKGAYLVRDPYNVKKIVVDVRNADGTPYDGYAETYLRGRISYEEGYYEGSFGMSLMGAHGEFTVPSNHTLDNITFESISNANVTIKLEEGKTDSRRRQHNIFIFDTEGTLHTYPLNPGQTMDLPDLSTSDKKIEGYTDGRRMYKVGQTVSANLISSCYIPVLAEKNLLQAGVATRFSTREGVPESFEISGVSAETMYVLDFEVTQESRLWNINIVDKNGKAGAQLLQLKDEYGNVFKFSHYVGSISDTDSIRVCGILDGSLNLRPATSAEIAYAESHILIVDSSDDIELNLTIKGTPYDNEYMSDRYSIVSADGSSLSNRRVVIEYRNPDGSYYEGYTESYFIGYDPEDIGYSSRALVGPHAEYFFDREIEYFRPTVQRGMNDITVTLRLVKDPAGDEVPRGKAILFMVRNGQLSKAIVNAADPIVVPEGKIHIVNGKTFMAGETSCDRIYNSFCIIEKDA